MNLIDINQIMPSVWWLPIIHKISPLLRHKSPVIWSSLQPDFLVVLVHSSHSPFENRQFYLMLPNLPKLLDLHIWNFLYICLMSSKLPHVLQFFLLKTHILSVSISQDRLLWWPYFWKPHVYVPHLFLSSVTSHINN